MTPQEILTDVRKINALVAEKVMGWCEVDTVTGLNPKLMERAIPNYCQDISAAWDVVEKLKGGSSDSLLGFSMFWNKSQDSYHCGFMHKKEVDDKSAPMAICLAALKSVGIEVKDDQINKRSARKTKSVRE